MATAVLLLDRIPNKTIGGDMPSYRMFGKHADLSFLRSIGARGFINNKGNLRMLDPRAREGVFIGYDDDKPIYRIYFREIVQVTITRNVTFIEVQPAAIPTASGTGGQSSSTRI